MTLKTKELNDEVITITLLLSKYNEMLRDQDLLQCLRGAGVDNWEGWDDSCVEHGSFVEFKNE